MTIDKHDHKNRIVIELDENEFTLLAYLIEKSSRKTKKDGMIKASLDVKMNKEFRKFLTEEMS